MFFGGNSFVRSGSQACGAPNIKGTYTARENGEGIVTASGALYHAGYGWSENAKGGDGNANLIVGFDASRGDEYCKKVYIDKLPEIRPTNYSVKIWKRED